MKDFKAGYAEMNARLELFNASLAAMTDEELFQTFHFIEKEREIAKAGNAENDSEDLLLKERQTELEICKRHPEQMMHAYEIWLAGQIL
jgi:hypothetical protein